MAIPRLALNSAMYLMYSTIELSLDVLLCLMNEAFQERNLIPVRRGWAQLLAGRNFFLINHECSVPAHAAAYV